MVFGPDARITNKKQIETIENYIPILINIVGFNVHLILHLILKCGQMIIQLLFIMSIENINIFCAKSNI